MNDSQIKTWMVYKALTKDGIPELKAEARSNRKMTGEEICKYVARFLKLAFKITISPIDLWNLSPRGELAHVFILRNFARSYFLSKRSE